MNGTASRGEQSARAGGGWLAVAAIAAYAAAALAFGYALICVYCTLGGHGLLGTVGGAIERFARRGGITATLVGLATTLVKSTGGVLALALIRTGGASFRERGCWPLPPQPARCPCSTAVPRCSSGRWCSPAPSTRRGASTAARCAGMSGSGTSGSTRRCPRPITNARTLVGTIKTALDASRRRSPWVVG
jgi:hypothetical protein